MRSLRRVSLALPLLGGFLGCMFSPGECNYEHRSIEFAGTLAAPAETLGASIGASLMLNETRGSNPDFRTLHVEFSGTLAGEMAFAELRDVGSGVLLATLPAGTGWSTNVDIGPSPTQETLAALAGQGRLLLRLVRTPETLPIVKGLLTVTARTDWSHPRCD